MTTNSTENNIIMAAAVMATFFVPLEVNATSEGDDEDFVPEICNIRLKTGQMIQVTRDIL